MQLTQYSDFSFRVLVFLALKKTGLSTVSEIAAFYGISRNHLVKVIHNLANKGFIVTTRGRNGGMTLSRSPAEIYLGDVARNTEPNFNIVECFDIQHNHCHIAPSCALKSMFWEAKTAFLDTLDGYTLADAIAGAEPESKIVSMPQSTRRNQVVI